MSYEDSNALEELRFGEWSSPIGVPDSSALPQYYRFRMVEPVEDSMEYFRSVELKFEGNPIIWVLAPPRPLDKSECPELVASALKEWPEQVINSSYLEYRPKFNFLGSIIKRLRPGSAVNPFSVVQIRLPMHGSFLLFSGPTILVRKDQRLTCVLDDFEERGFFAEDIEWAIRNHAKRVLEAYAKRTRDDVVDLSRAMQLFLDCGIDRTLYSDLEAGAVSTVEKELATDSSIPFHFLETLILENRLANWNLPEPLVKRVEELLSHDGVLPDSQNGPLARLVESGELPHNSWQVSRCRDVWSIVRRPGNETAECPVEGCTNQNLVFKNPAPGRYVEITCEECGTELAFDSDLRILPYVGMEMEASVITGNHGPQLWYKRTGPEKYTAILDDYSSLQPGDSIWMRIISVFHGDKSMEAKYVKTSQES